MGLRTTVTEELKENSNNQNESSNTPKDELNQSEKQRLMREVAQMGTEASSLKTVASLIEQQHIDLQQQLNKCLEDCEAIQQTVGENTKKTCEILLENVKNCLTEVQSQNEEWQSANQELLNSNNSLTEQLNMSVNAMNSNINSNRQDITTALTNYNKAQQEAVCNLVSGGIAEATNRVEATISNEIDKFDKMSEQIEKKAYEANLEAENWSKATTKIAKGYRGQMLLSSLMLLIAIGIMILSFYFVSQYIQPISKLNSSMSQIEALSDNLMTVNNQISTYYNRVAGDNIVEARLETMWSNGHYGTALWMIFKAWWKWLLLIGNIGYIIIKIARRD